MITFLLSQNNAGCIILYKLQLLDCRVWYANKETEIVVSVAVLLQYLVSTVIDSDTQLNLDCMPNTYPLDWERIEVLYFDHPYCQFLAPESPDT